MSSYDPPEVARTGRTSFRRANQFMRRYGLDRLDRPDPMGGPRRTRRYNYHLNPRLDSFRGAERALQRGQTRLALRRMAYSNFYNQLADTTEENIPPDQPGVSITPSDVLNAGSGIDEYYTPVTIGGHFAARPRQWNSSSLHTSDGGLDLRTTDQIHRDRGVLAPILGGDRYFPVEPGHVFPGAPLLDVHPLDVEQHDADQVVGTFWRSNVPPAYLHQPVPMRHRYRTPNIGQEVAPLFVDPAVPLPGMPRASIVNPDAVVDDSIRIARHRGTAPPGGGPRSLRNTMYDPRGTFLSRARRSVLRGEANPSLLDLMPTDWERPPATRPLVGRVRAARRRRRRRRRDADPYVRRGCYTRKPRGRYHKRRKNLY